ncbi:MAG: serine hydrolase [Oscillibacter sp.]|nr:serine hydrolase [Oscillibacter sp.]
MDDLQVILDELDRMESESKARERERARIRRWRVVKHRRKERQRKQLTLLLFIFCGLLALPVSSAISARLHGASETLTAAYSVPYEETFDGGDTLVGDQSLKADVAARSGEPAGADFYAYENPENLLPGQAQPKVAENPENLLPTTGNYASPSSTPSQSKPAASADTSAKPAATVDPLTENPENLLPGETSDYASTRSASQKFVPARGAKTITLGQSAEISSQYAVLLDADTGYIYAERNSDVKVPPASMTKVLTLLVAVEKLIKVTPEGVKGMDTKVTITKPVTDYCYANNCSIAGFSRWETVTVRDLLYGCILPSGADACLALARHISGSHEAFVELMNQKLEELGISKTAHFTNCIGLYNPDHYCTMRDMAVIMRAAMNHSICRVILSARTFRTSSTAEHKKGISLSNLFLRRIEDRFTGTTLDVRGAKTGYVRQSGNCAVSYATRKDGKNFICVTGKGSGQWAVISDHTLLYRAYCLN